MPLAAATRTAGRIGIHMGARPQLLLGSTASATWNRNGTPARLMSPGSARPRGDCQNGNACGRWLLLVAPGGCAEILTVFLRPFARRDSRNETQLLAIFTSMVSKLRKAGN